MKLLDILRKLGLIRENGIFYIGGSDVLPPPLKGSEELLTLQALEPVSYTHLDVYKRQDFWCLPAPILCWQFP